MRLQLNGCRSYTWKSRATGATYHFERGRWLDIPHDKDWEWLTSGSGMKFVEEPLLGERLLGDAVASRFDGDKSGSLLVCRGRGLGDVLLMVPALREWKRRYPASTVGVVVDKGYRRFFLDAHFVDYAMDFHEAYERGPWDVVANLNFYAEKSEEDTVLHRSVVFGHGLGVEVSDLKLGYRTLEPERKAAQELLRGVREPFVVVRMQASTPTRCPSLEKMHVILSTLVDNGYTAVAMGSKEEPLPPNVIDLQASRCSLEVAPAVMERAAVVVGHDTGMTHMANALGVPTVALFGPGDPKLRVAGQSSCHPLELWHYGGCEEPCRDHRRKTCRLRPQCLEWFPVEEVVKAVEETVHASSHLPSQ